MQVINFKQGEQEGIDQTCYRFNKKKKIGPLAGIFKNTVPEEKKEEPIPKKVEKIKHAEARTIAKSDHAETSKASERTMSSAKPQGSSSKLLGPN
jgi:hypothetical protein